MDGCNFIMNMRLPLQLQKGIYDFIHILQMLKVNIKVKGVILDITYYNIYNTSILERLEVR